VHFQQGKPKELKAVEYPELKRGERERERESENEGYQACF